MKRAVIDASVLVKLFFAEEHSHDAEQFVRTIPDLLAPDLIWSEATSVIWKRYRRGELGREDACEIATQLLSLPLSIHASADLIADALELAMQFDRTVYDSLYIALAVKTNSVMLSGDQRLVNAMTDTPLQKHVAWIGGSK